MEEDRAEYKKGLESQTYKDWSKRQEGKKGLGFGDGGKTVKTNLSVVLVDSRGEYAVFFRSMREREIRPLVNEVVNGAINEILGDGQESNSEEEYGLSDERVMMMLARRQGEHCGR